jgi:hypothetical protein
MVEVFAQLMQMRSSFTDEETRSYQKKPSCTLQSATALLFNYRIERILLECQMERCVRGVEKNFGFDVRSRNLEMLNLLASGLVTCAAGYEG